MIEIILRNDIADYEPRPLFGLTYRAAATAVAIVATALALAFGLGALGVDGTAMLTAVALACGAEGLVGVGKVRGMYFLDWARIVAADRRAPAVLLFSAPTLRPACGGDETPSRRPAKRDRAEIDAESEAIGCACVPQPR